MTKEKIIFLSVYLLVSLSFFILNLVIKKKPVSNELDKVLKNLLLILPCYVYDAEALALNGKEKLEFVLKKSIDFINARIKLSDSEMVSCVEMITNEVELILSTPRKKDLKK